MADGRDLARQLLDRAADDEVAAREMVSVAHVADAIVAFHAQQAVEKASPCENSGDTVLHAVAVRSTAATRVAA
jgi:hypothetical protein